MLSRVRLLGSRTWRRGIASLSLSLSIRQGPTSPPLLHRTIPEHFSSIVSRHGSLPALISRPPTTPTLTLTPPPLTLSYHTLDTLSNRLASSLASTCNVHHGVRVAALLGNTPEHAILVLALAKLGAVLVPLNPTLLPGQVASALGHVGAQTLVLSAFADLAYRPARGRSNEPLISHLLGDSHSNASSKIQSEAVPSLENVVVVDNREFHHHPHPESSPGAGSFTFNITRPGLLHYDDLIAHGSEQPVKPIKLIRPEDTANIQFTSGTTAAPKAAMLSHLSTLNNALSAAHNLAFSPSDRIVVPPPLFHCFGLVMGFLATASTGACILLPSPAFDPRATLTMAAEFNATGLYGVGTMFIALFQELDSPQNPPPTPQHLVKGIAAGSPVPPSLMDKIRARLGMEGLVICYGMTETSPVSCMTTPSDPPSVRTSTVGRAMPHTTVKIVDEQRKHIVPVGEKGELACSGYLVMKGYWNDPQRTKESLVEDEDGRVWMYTGDEAEMDAEGYVRVTGRIKDLIIRGGENIHPLEVEECIYGVEGVRDVAVCGVPDDVLGEAVAAFIILEGGYTPESLQVGDRGEKGQGKVLTKGMVRAHVKHRLAGQLVPKYVFFVEEYPKTASGKVQRFQLQAMVKDRLPEGL